MNEKVIIARKRSSDPAQEHLREQKAIWNQATKDLIFKLIAFKRGLNGRGDPKSGLPPSDIKDPFPPQIGQYLDDIATHYTALVDGAEKIIQEQENYSRIRRKPQSDVPSNNQILSVDDGYVIKEAAWWGSKWWASNFGIKGPDRPLIASILRSCDSLHNKLLDVENHLTSSDPNGIPKALYITSSFGIGPYKNILEVFKKMRELHGRVLSDPPTADDIKAEMVKPSIEQAKNIPAEKIKDTFNTQKEKLVAILQDLGNLQSVVNEYLARSDNSTSYTSKIKKLKSIVNRSGDISDYITKLSQSVTTDGVEHTLLSEKEFIDVVNIISAYKELLEFFSSVFKEKSDTFESYAKKIQSLPEVKAHNPLSRFIKRKWLEHKPDFIRSDVDLDMRKNIAVEHISDTILSLKEMMDILIQSPGIDEVFRCLKKLSKTLSIVIEDIIVLAEYHTTMFRNENRNNRKGVILHPIIEREINKLRKTNIGIKEMSDKILINRPDIITVING